MTSVFYNEAMKKLTMFEKSPLITAIIEIRFKHPAGDIVSGLIYNALSEKYKQSPEELPTNQIPAQIRNNDPGLIYAPTHKVGKGNKSIAFGPRSVSLTYDVFTKNAYPGWKATKLELDTIVSLLKKAGLLNSIERIGVRYVNFLQEKDLLSKLTFKIYSVWSDTGALDEEMNLGFIVNDSSFKTQVKINTSSNIRNDKYEVNKKGQIIDLDTTLSRGIDASNVLANIDKAHETTKKVFVDLFEESYFKTMGPSYE